MNDIAISFKNIGKSFPGVRALDQVSFDVARGEVHCLLGENGAGKSTLIKILAGVQPYDEGGIEMFGEEVNFKSPSDAKKAGIGVVYQELSNFIELDVASNLMGNNFPVNRGVINYKGLYARARKKLDDCGLSIDEKQPMRNLSLGEQQMVEIARLLGENVKVVILDEPTSALTEKEVKKLYELIAMMKENGVTIIYISHRLDEVMDIADSITILKDGAHVTTFQKDENTTQKMLVQNMVGRDVAFNYNAGSTEIGGLLLEVEGLCSGDAVKDISLELRQGEILGIAGLEGSGRTELLETLFGWREKTSGDIKISGKNVDIRNTIDAKKNGMAYITKERKLLGLFLGLDVSSNISAASPDNYKKRGVIDYKAVDKNAEKYVKAMKIKCASLSQKVLNLSGGNQQKVLLSMWLSEDPDIFLIDEPTRGIDVGAKAEIHALLRDVVSRGKGVIMVSSELPEIMASCDRVIVMYEGEVKGILDNKELTEETIMMLASGL